MMNIQYFITILNIQLHVQLIQVANDQFMPVKEAIQFLISFGGHIFEIIAYLLPFSAAFDFISGLKL